MTKGECKKAGCKDCKNYCEPREDYPMGTCIAATSYMHGLDKMEYCPKTDEYYEDLE